MGGDALTLDKPGATRFWNTLTTGGLRKLWLDRKVRATLDKSVPQIGAPAAWKSGYTGKNVRVAVLDTGYDKAHPDLKGVVKAAKDFTGSKSGVQDGDGHGTHVSSILAGRGVAAKGRYTGVARGAQLVEGKVLGDDGEGSYSTVLAGMEWAAGRAKVINMSLGGDDTPEVDPLEEAVARLTKKTGALFVIAAGNRGPDAGTVGSPGRHVHRRPRTDHRARRRDRGHRHHHDPRKGPAGLYGGYLTATTPDRRITVRTALGGYKEPESYDLTIKLLDRDGREPGQNADSNNWSVFDYGRDVESPSGASGDKVRLRAGRYAVIGYVSTPRAGQSQQAAAALAEPDLELKENTRLTLDSRTAQRVQMEVDRPTARADARYLGMLTKAPPQAGYDYFAFMSGVPSDVQEVYAGSHGASPRFAFAALARFKEPLIRLDAEAPQAFPVQVWYARNDDGEDPPALLGTHRMDAVYGGAGTAEDLARIKPRGKLVVLTLEAEDDAAVPARVRAVRDAGGRALLLARRSGPPAFGARLPLPAIFTTLPEGRRLADLAGQGPVTVVTRGITDSPYAYHLAHVSDTRVPAAPVYHDKTADLGNVRTTYRGPGGRWDAFVDTGVLWRGRDMGYGWSEPIHAPLTRTEYFSPSGVRFSRYVIRNDGHGQTTTWRSYQGGRQLTETVLKGVLGPSFATPYGNIYDPRPAWAYRAGDKMDLLIPALSDTEAGHYAVSSYGITGSVKLYRKGKLIGTSKEPARARFTVPAGKGRYRLESVVKAGSASWRVSGTVRSTWTFASARTARATALPLMTTRYLPGLDAMNRAPAGKSLSFPVRVEHQPRSTRATPAALTVQASYDDGRTWRKVTLRPGGGHWTATVRNPAQGYVSLRAIAKDTAGNTAEQTILHAYGLTK